MLSTLCINTDEVAYDYLKGTSPKDIRGMTLEELEKSLGRLLDHEDMEYVPKQTCEKCKQRYGCGEYNRET